MTLDRSVLRNTIGLNLLIAVAVGAPLSAVTASDWGMAHPRMLAVAALCGTCLLAAIAVWQVVGCWRCADRCKQNNERALGRFLVRSFLILGVLLTLGRFYIQGGPLLKEELRIAAGDPHWPAHKVSLLSDGSALRIEGPLRTGITDEVENALRAHPEIKSVSIESPGGRANESYRLFDLFSQRKLHLHASGTCDSACAIAFAGGDIRTATQSSRFGFHASGFPAQGGAELFAVMAQDVRDTRDRLSRAGVAQGLIERIVATPNERILRPPLEDLVAAGYLHRVVEARDDSKRGEAYRSEQPAKPTPEQEAGPELSAEGDKRPGRRSDDGRSDDGGRADLQKARRGLSQSAALSEWAAEFVTSGDLARNFGKIPDAEMLDLVFAQLNALRQVREGSVDTCARAAKEPTSAQIAPHLTTEVRDSLNRALVKAYFASIRVQRPFRAPPDFDAQASTLLKRVAERVPATPRILANPGSPQASSKELCDFQITLMEELLKLPKSKAAAVWRSAQTTE